MKRKFKFFTLLGFIPILAMTQQTNQVISTAGSQMKKTSFSLTYTIGQTSCNYYKVIGTIVNQPVLIYNEGFIQSPSLLLVDQDLSQRLSSNSSELEMSEASILVFPNPFSSKVQLNISNIKEYKITLFDMQGNAIKIADASIDNNTNILDLQKLLNGSYLLRITDLETNLTYNKIIVKH